MKKFLGIINFTLLALTWWAVINNYSHLPIKVPTHFGPSGVPDAWGPKPHIFVAPIVYTGIFILFIFIYLFAPHRVNLGLHSFDIRSLPAPLKRKAYDLVRRTLLIVGIGIGGLFFHITATTIRVARGEMRRLNPVYLIFCIGLIIVYTIYSIRRLSKLKREVDQGQISI